MFSIVPTYSNQDQILNTWLFGKNVLLVYKYIKSYSNNIYCISNNMETPKFFKWYNLKFVHLRLKKSVNKGCTNFVSYLCHNYKMI